MIESTDDEVEEFRLERLAERAREHNEAAESLAERFKPGSMGFHEALHTTSVMLDSVDRHIADHPAVLARPELYRLAHRAQEALFNLYQELGELSSGGDD